MSEVARPAKLTTERRRHPRVNMKMAINFKSIEKDAVSRSLKTQSDDISAGGLAMRTPQKLRHGQLLMLNLFLPVSGKMKETGDQPLDFTKSTCHTASILSRVAYCTKLEGTYKLGVQFLDLDKNNRKLLKSFLVKCQLLKPNSKLYS